MLKTFLSDDSGNPSTIRVMSMLALISAIGYGIMIIDDPTAEQVRLVGQMLIGAFAPKAVQKFAENKTV